MQWSLHTVLWHLMLPLFEHMAMTSDHLVMLKTIFLLMLVMLKTIFLLMLVMLKTIFLVTI